MLRNNTAVAQAGGDAFAAECDNGEAVSSLQATDWNEEWKRLQRIRRKQDDAQYWNTRSKNFGIKDAPNPYVAEFIELAALQPGEHVMDMGCGTGSLAVPLALDGHPILAADFSQGMLDEMDERIRAVGVQGIESRLMSWDDDWKSHSVPPKCVDVAFASRSIATGDLRQALAKLTAVARRRCCITLTTGCSPRMDQDILKAIGLTNRHGRDFQYAWNILVNDGFMPTCSYIRSMRKDTFDDLEESVIDFGRMVDDTVDAGSAEARQAKDRLRIWLQDNLVRNEDAGAPDRKGSKEKLLRLKDLRTVDWAFIAWSL